MTEFNLRVQIDQHTELPLLIEGVEERLTWMRNWSSWSEYKLNGLSLFHLDTLEHERAIKTSLLGVDTNKEAPSIEVAVTHSYEDISSKLNILSFLTGKGFNIMTIGLPFELGEKSRFRRWVITQLERYFWLTRQGAVIVGDSQGRMGGEIRAGERKIFVTSTKGYQYEEYEIIGDIREKTVTRDFASLPLAEIDRRWRMVWDAFEHLPEDERLVLMRALDFYRGSRTSRDVFSRYIIMWTAMDSLTPYVGKFGTGKTNGIASFIGNISGFSSLSQAVSDLYNMRNDIAHSRRLDSRFPIECKQKLTVLEWIFSCYLLKRMGLPQLPENRAPVLP